MFDKGKRARRDNEADAVFNRMLLWLAGAVVLELFILLLEKVYVNFLFGVNVAVGLSYFFLVFLFAGAVLAVGGVVWALMNSRNGKSAVLPLAIAGGSALLWIISLLAHFMFLEGFRILTLLPAAGAVLILVFFLYQRPFFYNALLIGGGILALWLHRKYYWTHPTVIRACFAGGIAVLAIAAVLFFLLRQRDGKLAWLRVLPVQSDYLMSFLTCGVTALVMVLGLAMPAAVQWLLYVLVGWLFAQAVFFTVKMM